MMDSKKATLEGESKSKAQKRGVKGRVNPSDKHRQDKNRISGCGSADESRMYAKLILSKVKSLEVELATLSRKCSKQRSTSREVEVVNLESEDEESGGGENHKLGQEHGNDDLSRFKKETEENCRRIHGDVVTLRKLVESLVDHVQERESESKSSTGARTPTTSSSSNALEVPANAFDSDDDDDSNSYLKSLKVTSNAGLIKHSGASGEQVALKKEGSLRMTGLVPKATPGPSTSTQSPFADSLPANASKSTLPKVGRRGDDLMNLELEAGSQAISAIGSASTSNSVDPVGSTSRSSSVSRTGHGIGETSVELGKSSQAQASTSTSNQAQNSSHTGPRSERRKKEVGINLDCIFCQKQLAWKYDLEEHILSHIEERPNFCSLCPYECSQKGNLKRHLETHTDGGHLKCKVCSKSFRLKSDLARHIRFFHEKILFKCNECNNAFKYKYHLNRHIRAAHKDEKNHCCGICGSKFSQTSTLESHIRSHTGERPYKCRFCGKLFKQLCSQQYHEKTHRK